MLTKGQIFFIFIGAFILLTLTVMYETLVQLNNTQTLTIDLWFALCFLIFLAVDVIIEFDFKDRNSYILHNIILFSGTAIFIILVIYKFLIMVGIMT